MYQRWEVSLQKFLAAKHFPVPLKVDRIKSTDFARIAPAGNVIIVTHTSRVVLFSATTGEKVAAVGIIVITGLDCMTVSMPTINVSESDISGIVLNAETASTGIV